MEEKFTLYVVCALCGCKETCEVASYEERPMVCPSCGMTTLIVNEGMHPDYDGGLPF